MFGIDAAKQYLLPSKDKLKLRATGLGEENMEVARRKYWYHHDTHQWRTSWFTTLDDPPPDAAG